MIYHLNRSTTVLSSIGKVWDFIASPENLNRITPENMGFQLITEPPIAIFNGLLIEYDLTIPLFGRWRWLTEIKHIRQGHSFVDEQLAGPYKLWYHYHEVQPYGEGTRIIDQVTYQMPFGIAGDIIHALIVKRQLQDIFDYREKTFKHLLSE
jgi:ligand-binding SRPBCC domain-containing protein